MPRSEGCCTKWSREWGRLWRSSGRRRKGRDRAISTPLTSELSGWHPLLQVVEEARSVCVLRGWRGRRHPGRVGEIEDLGHVGLGGVAGGERRQAETGLDQLEPRGVVGRGVIHEVLHRER